MPINVGEKIMNKKFPTNNVFIGRICVVITCCFDDLPEFINVCWFALNTFFINFIISCCFHFSSLLTGSLLLLLLVFYFPVDRNSQSGYLSCFAKANQQENKKRADCVNRLVVALRTLATNRKIKNGRDKSKVKSNRILRIPEGTHFNRRFQGNYVEHVP